MTNISRHFTEKKSNLLDETPIKYTLNVALGKNYIDVCPCGCKTTEGALASMSGRLKSSVSKVLLNLDGLRNDIDKERFNLLKVKERINEITNKGSIVVTIGDSSVGMGKKRGFITAQILIISHGFGPDVLVSVEYKTNSSGAPLKKYRAKCGYKNH